MTDEVQHAVINTTKCGMVNVYVQGSLEDKQGKTIFVTVHDMGTNHSSMIGFVNHPSMVEVKARSVFIHVCVPGQEDNAPNWSGENYPSLQDIASDLVCVLDHFDVRTVIGFGQGAGANVVCRFAIVHPNRCLGVCLVKCTSTTAGVMEYVKDKYIKLQLDSNNMHSAAYEYLTVHRFGQKADDKSDVVVAYVEDLKKHFNPVNLAKYLNSFCKRTDLSSSLATDLKCDTLLVVGSKASHLHTVYTMHQAMNREKTTLLVVDGVGDVMSEAADKLTRGMILFCKGFGALSGVAMPGMEKTRTLSASMEEADRPRRSSVGGKE